LSRKLWSAFAAFIMPLALTAAGVFTNQPSAQADPTVTTIPWPGNPLPYAAIYAHGDSSFTVAEDNCVSTATGTTSIVTENTGLSTVNKVLQGTGGWSTTNCDQTTVPGSDGTIYFIQRNPAGSQRLIAVRNSVTLWTRGLSFCSSTASVNELKLGYDGNLYASISTGCGTLMLVGINSATGQQRFTTQLPSSDATFGNEIHPYSTGVAVRNNGSRVYYYTYSGTPETPLTFVPPTPYISYVSGTIAVTASGRTFLIDPGNHTLFYKDTDSQTVHVIALSNSDTLSQVFATPAGGVIANFSRSGVPYFDYFDSSGTKLYEKNLYSDDRGSPNALYHEVVDSLGNYLVERRISLPAHQNDQYVFLDSFDASGTATQLFDSGSIAGSSTKTDYFSLPTQSSGMPLSLADGKIYIPLCYYGAPLGGGPATGCLNPSVVSITIPGSFDYPRSAAFAAQAGKANYVALGDSYSSGEGNPSFIAPSDTDGCHRSFAAYPTLVALASNSSLRAFVACSGATTNDVVNGHDGEPSQLDSLDAGTDTVTITVGGDDAEFSDFAEECVIGTCDSASAQYQTTMEIIGDPLLLQASLESLFEQVRSATPNAVIDVVGYPDVVAPGGNCPTYLSSGEQIAVETVVTGLNNDLRTAVSDSGSGFQFIDPTVTGSPFDGHDLCSADSYFNGLSIPQTQYSFHPNAAGQAAYAELIANNM